MIEAVCPECKIEEIGIRPGEKIHEEMITISDSVNTIDAGDYYIILPPMNNEKYKKYLSFYNAKPVEVGFSYSSGNNKEWLTIKQIREQIKENLDDSFIV